MIWFIISLVTAGGMQGHPFGSERHFFTEAECTAYLPIDAEELADELEERGIKGPLQIEAHCEIDPEAGTPV